MAGTSRSCASGDEETLEKNNIKEERTSVFVLLRLICDIIEKSSFVSVARDARR
jgi:hypothetical protein